MSEVLTERFEMRLSKAREYQLEFIVGRTGAESKADVMRRLIIEEYNKIRCSGCR